MLRYIPFDRAVLRKLSCLMAGPLGGGRVLSTTTVTIRWEASEAGLGRAVAYVAVPTIVLTSSYPFFLFVI
jgi:hypothetical protein